MIFVIMFFTGFAVLIVASCFQPSQLDRVLGKFGHFLIAVIPMLFILVGAFGAAKHFSVP